MASALHGPAARPSVLGGTQAAAERLPLCVHACQGKLGRPSFFTNPRPENQRSFSSKDCNSMDPVLSGSATLGQQRDCAERQVMLHHTPSYRHVIIMGKGVRAAAGASGGQRNRAGAARGLQTRSGRAAAPARKQRKQPGHGGAERLPGRRLLLGSAPGSRREQPARPLTTRRPSVPHAGGGNTVPCRPPRWAARNPQAQRPLRPRSGTEARSGPGA